MIHALRILLLDAYPLKLITYNPGFSNLINHQPSQIDMLTLSQSEHLSTSSNATAPTLALPPVTPTTQSSPTSIHNISSNSFENNYTTRHYVSPQINQRIQSIVRNHPISSSAPHALRPRRRSICYKDINKWRPPNISQITSFENAQTLSNLYMEASIIHLIRIFVFLTACFEKQVMIPHKET